MSTHKQTFLTPMIQPDRPIYLDCAATTPIDPRVRDVVLHYMDVEFGNAGSRTHIYGQEAARGIREAREQIAAVVDARPEEVIFTSGATESNNLALLGLAKYGIKTGKQHIISTQIEHKAVLEPLQHLQEQGFEIEYLKPLKTGYVDPDDVRRHLRQDTVLVAAMHVNNETGTTQPISEICSVLSNHPCFFHVDSAQGFGKELPQLQNSRIDSISVSAHKLYAPKGVGALIARSKNKFNRALSPLTFGGAQERGLRPGTIPCALVCGFAFAATLSATEQSSHRARWKNLQNQFLQAIDGLRFEIIGDLSYNQGNILSFRIENIDSELIILSLKELISISTGSACTSDRIEPSHVIEAITNDSAAAAQVCRASWCHLTPDIPVGSINSTLRQLAS